MSEAKRAGNGPLKVDLIAGQNYAYCTCGESSNQPFCDGAHSGTGFQPLVFKAIQDGPSFLCACKATGRPPYCDGSHSR